MLNNNKTVLALSFVLLIVFISRKTNSQTPDNSVVCAKSFQPLNRSIEITNCLTLNREISVNLKCDVIYAYERKEKLYNAIDIKIMFIENNANEIVENEFANLSSLYFEWYKVMHDQIMKLGNDTVFLKNDTNNSLVGKLILYGIFPETMYRVCIDKVPRTLITVPNPDDLCCQVELIEEIEEYDELMIFIVLATLLVIYIIVILVNCFCPPHAYRSLDEMLGSLPTAHVDKLRKLIEDKEEHIKEADEHNLGDENERVRSLGDPVLAKYMYMRNNKNRRRRSSTKRSEFDNKGYESGDDLDRSGAEDTRTRTESESSNKAPHQTVVKFADEDEVIDDIGKIKLKVFKEVKRRASIKPFKKAYTLNVSSESEESDKS